MKTAMSLRVPGNLIQAIDAYEVEQGYTKPAKLLERITQVLPQSGQVELLYVCASNCDKTVTIVYLHDGVEKGRSLPITEPKSLGSLLFLHAICTLPVYSALVMQYEFDYIYYFARRIAANVVPGDDTTYPNYVKRINAAMVANQSEDFEFNAFRFAMVSNERDPENTIAHRAVVRYVARSCTTDLSSNFNEVYPVVQFGPYISFNSIIPFPAQMIGPYDNNCILPIVEELGMAAKDAVELVDNKPVLISSMNGIDRRSMSNIVLEGQA